MHGGAGVFLSNSENKGSTKVYLNYNGYSDSSYTNFTVMIKQKEMDKYELVKLCLFLAILMTVKGAGKVKLPLMMSN